MITITKKVLSRGFAFATTRSKIRRERNPSGDHQQPEQKDVFRAYRKQVQKSSILRQFRQDVFRRAELVEDWDEQTRKQKEQAKVEKMMGTDKEEMLARATQIQSRANQSRSIFDENTGRSMISNYGNYKTYDKVHPVVKDRNMGELQYLQDSHVQQNLYKYIDQLPNDYQEKEDLRMTMSILSPNQQKMSLSQYGKSIQDKMNQAQRQQLRAYEEYKIHTINKYALVRDSYGPDDVDMDWVEDLPDDVYDYTGVIKVVDHQDHGEGLEATLSPEAIDTIYQLYLQGWNVRDISKRFGILPARTKFCVWVRAQLYHEVIPKLGVKYYLRLLRLQQRYNRERSFCDYGLDIDSLSNDGILTEITEWNEGMLDAQRKEEEYKGAMLKLQQEKKFKKYEMVTVGTLGQEHKLYRLKEWKIFRGKGSDHYFLKHNMLISLTREQKKIRKMLY